jgi:hypothetical protein
MCQLHFIFMYSLWFLHAFPLYRLHYVTLLSRRKEKRNFSGCGRMYFWSCDLKRVKWTFMMMMSMMMEWTFCGQNTNKFYRAMYSVVEAKWWGKQILCVTLCVKWTIDSLCLYHCMWILNTCHITWHKCFNSRWVFLNKHYNNPEWTVNLQRSTN